MSTQASESLNEKVIKKLEEAINILRHTEIKDNEKPLAEINEHVDGILSNLKYFPTGLSFGNLPTEIKTDILSYLCNLGAFMASSVSQEWRNIMESRLKKIGEVRVGKHCSNEYECEDKECFIPEEILKSSLILKSDIPLSLCYPLTDVESDVIIEGLVNVSSFSIQGACTCVDKNIWFGDNKPILTDEVFDKLFEALNKKSGVISSVKLAELDLRGLNQGKLIDCLLKTHSLTLDGGEVWKGDKMINVHNLAKRLLQASEGNKLKYLNLYNLNLLNDPDEDRYMDSLTEAEDFGNAFCNVYSVHLDLGSTSDLDQLDLVRMMLELIDSIIVDNRPIALRKIKIYKFSHWNAVAPEFLKPMIEKLAAVDLTGRFSPEQVEAVRFLAGVEASVDRISKGEFD